MNWRIPGVHPCVGCATSERGGAGGCEFGAGLGRGLRRSLPAAKKPYPRSNQIFPQPYSCQSDRDRVAQVEAHVSLIEKIPTLSDEEVINLLANARRLQSEGDEKRQAQASELIPPLEEAAAQRRAARQAAIQAKRAARRPKKHAA